MSKVHSTFKTNDSYAIMSLRFLLSFLTAAPRTRLATQESLYSRFQMFWSLLAEYRKKYCKYEPSDLSKDFADHFMTLRNQSQTNSFLIQGKGSKVMF